jgi:hypothetical protein
MLPDYYFEEALELNQSQSRFLRVDGGWNTVQLKALGVVVDVWPLITQNKSLDKIQMRQSEGIVREVIQDGSVKIETRYEGKCHGLSVHFHADVAHVCLFYKDMKLSEFQFDSSFTELDDMYYARQGKALSQLKAESFDPRKKTSSGYI